MSLNLDLLLEPETLAPLLDHPELLLVDVCQPQNWQRAHLPGAAHINPTAMTAGTFPAPGNLPDLASVEALFSSIGYRPDLHIVVYDDEGGGWAGRFIWMLDMIGHQHYSYLNGGLFAWYKEAHPLTDDVRVITPTTVSLTLQPQFSADMQEVKASLNNPDICIWDARSAEEYNGLRSSSARAGHIPGAVNLDWLDTMDRENNLRLLPKAELTRRLAQIGISPGKHIITHCQSHHRSGLTYLVAKLLGYSVQAYPGSWCEWGNSPDAPVEAMA